jgi:drug/metabolite transporter (DMT)-like permease
VVLLGRRAVRWGSGDLRMAAGVGLLDAGANALFALALTEGMSSTVSAIGSMFPVTTVILGAVLLRERLGWLQSVGVAGVLVGVGLVTACGGA